MYYGRYLPNNFERVIIIILINKEECKEIKKRFPNLHIRRTVSQKSKRGRYYMTERRDAMEYLANTLRNSNVSFSSDEENISDHLI